MEINFDPSRDSTINALGSAERQMLVNSTIPMSSESSSCSSLAAASSSFAIANETANERSEPIEDRASVAAAPFGIDIPSNLYTDEYQVSRDEVRRSSIESFTISRNGQIGPLRIRRFMFSTDGPYARRKKMEMCKEGVRIRKRPVKPRKNSVLVDPSKGSDKSGAEASGRHSICFATTFGATLKTVLDFAGISCEKKSQVAAALDDMAEFLNPVSKNMEHMSGADRDHLVNGLATRSVCRKQTKVLSECQIDRRLRGTWLYKSGQANVTLGATAAIIVAHYVLAVTGSQPNEVIDNLTRSITVTRNILDQWDTSCFAKSSMYSEALGAELRALERARASAAAAERVASSQKLDRLSALHLQLSYMRSAAWPAQALCAPGSSHELNVKRLQRGEQIKVNSSLPLIPVVAPSVQALCLLNKDISHRNDETCSESGFTCSTFSTSSTFSSASSTSTSSYTTPFSTYESDVEEEAEESCAAIVRESVNEMSLDIRTR